MFDSEALKLSLFWVKCSFKTPQRLLELCPKSSRWHVIQQLVYENAHTFCLTLLSQTFKDFPGLWDTVNNRL